MTALPLGARRRKTGRGEDVGAASVRIVGGKVAGGWTSGFF